MRDDLVERRAAVEAAEREREAGARGRERLEPERGEHARGAGVPRVRDHERLARVQRLERLRLSVLGSSLNAHKSPPPDRDEVLLRVVALEHRHEFCTELGPTAGGLGELPRHDQRAELRRL